MECKSIDDFAYDLTKLQLAKGFTIQINFVLFDGFFCFVNYIKVASLPEQSCICGRASF